MTDQTTVPFRASRILVPVDMRHAEVSRSAVDAAVYLARRTGAKVFVLTVANPLGTHLTEMPEAHKPEFNAFVSQEAQRLDYPITPLFQSHESVNEVIRHIVKQHDVDFVVMATHHPRLTDHLFGSHASQTALHANCSVLILRGA
jgi:nucleotide-binding universal stress UspA family protein